MNYKGHIIAGLIFLISIVLLDFYYFHFFFDVINWEMILLYSPIILFSFLLPDIDHQASKPKLVITILLIVVLLYYLFNNNVLYSTIIAFILLLIWIMGFLNGWQHRGHTHSIIFISLCSLLILFIDYKLAILFFIGAFSHLLFDAEIKLW